MARLATRLVEDRVKKVTVERPSKSEAILTIELGWDELEKASERAYRELAQRYNVPGFRRGHAPRSMLERMLGGESLYEHGLEHLVEDSYREAMRENHLAPLGQPDLETPPMRPNEDYTFTARVPVAAPVELGDLDAVRVERPRVEVSEADIDRVVNDLREQQALWIPVERPATVGDQVIADLKLTVGDRVINDLQDNPFELTDERAGVFHGMDEHLIGMSEGESKEFTTTIPEDYANTELAGQEGHYVVTLKGVKVRELPEIDDELAKASGEFDTLGGLREGIRDELRERRETNADRDFRERVLAAVADQAEVEIHPIMVREEVDAMVRETRNMLEQSHFGLEQFLSASGKTEEAYRQELEPEARARVKRNLVLLAIAEREGLTATDDETQAWLDVLGRVGGKRRRLRDLSRGQREFIAERIRREKATTFVIDAATARTAAEAGAAAAARAGADESPADESPAAARADMAETMASPDETAAPAAAPETATTETEAAAATADDGGASAPGAPSDGETTPTESSATIPTEATVSESTMSGEAPEGTMAAPKGGA
jgi:trigger factor